MEHLIERRALEERLGLLTRRIKGIENDFKEREEEDYEEQAFEIASDDVLEDLQEASLAELNQVRLALRRLDSGTFGRCVECGRKIDERRLKVLPQASRCIKCAS